MDWLLFSHGVVLCIARCWAASMASPVSVPVTTYPCLHCKNPEDLQALPNIHWGKKLPHFLIPNLLVFKLACRRTLGDSSLQPCLRISGPFLCGSKSGPQTRSSGITWELIRNLDSQSNRIRICIWQSPQGDACEHQLLEVPPSLLWEVPLAAMSCWTGSPSKLPSSRWDWEGTWPGNQWWGTIQSLGRGKSYFLYSLGYHKELKRLRSFLLEDNEERML